MRPDDCQRWRDGRDSYRPAGEVIDPDHYGVEVIEESVSKRFVGAHHYSRHRYPAARCAIGLFRAGKGLVGVAVFSVAANMRQVACYSDAVDGCDLGRFVLLDDVPANGETWFLARAMRALREEKPTVGAVVSYSDPIPRTTAEGHIVKPGHFGVIYQAHNARYVGLAKAEPLILDRAGQSISRRALSKIIGDEQGAAYAYRQLLAAGAPPRRPLEDGAVYVKRALREGPFRRFPHPGNHTYVWTLNRRVHHKKDPKPFPKAMAA